MTSRFTRAELERLLGRAPCARVEPSDREAFAGRRVVITGAAGSIGGELARELTASSPAVVGLVDQHELGLFSIERELSALWPGVRLEPHLVDITHDAALRRVLRDIRPDVVYHAAAYKHVTMAERSPAAAARVNVLGSINVATAARAVGARLVLISSDKASDPSSVMGATKRIAEIAVLSLASATFRPIVVRFGNVIGSSGSVVELMREAVRNGQAVTITDPDATRYFMTAGEAVALVLRADLLGRSAEIFWLDMGDPVRIGDLTTRVLALEREAGFREPAVQIIGLRPGEKRYETLTDRRLSFQRTIDRRILVAREAQPARRDLARALGRLRRETARANDLAVLMLLSSVLEEFIPSLEALDRARRLVAGSTAQNADRSKRKRQAA